jgi:hypothetical protein
MKKNELLLEISRIHEMMGVNSNNRIRIGLKSLILESLSRTIDDLIEGITKGTIKSVDELTVAERKLLNELVQQSDELRRVTSNLVDGLFTPAARKYLAGKITTSVDDMLTIFKNAANMTVKNTAKNIPSTVERSIDGIVAQLPDGANIGGKGADLKTTLTKLKDEGPDYITDDVTLSAYADYFRKVSTDLADTNTQISKYFGELADDMDVNFNARFGFNDVKLTEFANEIKTNGLVDEAGETIIEKGSDDFVDAGDEFVDDVVDAGDELSPDEIARKKEIDDLKAENARRQEIIKLQNEKMSNAKTKIKQMMSEESDLGILPAWLNKNKKDILKMLDDPEIQNMSPGEIMTAAKNKIDDKITKLEEEKVKLTNKRLNAGYKNTEGINFRIEQLTKTISAMSGLSKALASGGSLLLVAFCVWLYFQPKGTFSELVTDFSISQKEGIDRGLAKHSDLNTYFNVIPGYNELTDDQKVEIQTFGHSAENFDKDLTPKGYKVTRVEYIAPGDGSVVDKYKITYDDGTSELLIPGRTTSKQLGKDFKPLVNPNPNPNTNTNTQTQTQTQTVVDDLANFERWAGTGLDAWKNAGYTFSRNASTGMWEAKLNGTVGAKFKMNNDGTYTMQK